MNSENYLIDSDAVNAGGGYSTSGNYLLYDAFGDFAAGRGLGANYIEEGFIASLLFRVLNLTVSTTVLFSPKTVSALAQTTTGTIANVEVVNDDTAGWSLTMTSKHLTSTSSAKLLSGSNATVSFTGQYDGIPGVLDPNGTFVVEITNGGNIGTAIFKWTDPAGTETTGIVTASTVVLSRGISVQFSPAAYVAGDKWSVGVDVFPYTGLIITPSAITIVSGEGGVSAGSREALTGTGAVSSPKTLMTGSSGSSSGTYRQNENLELEVHPNSLEGNFTAEAVLTVI